MTTPTTLRALADRVCAEEPSELLRATILVADGWTLLSDNSWSKFIQPDDYDNRAWADLPNPLHNLSDAAAMMPAEASVSITQEDNGTWRVDVSIRWDPDDERSEWLFDVRAPDEKRARTAAALRVRAAMMEDGE